MNLVFFILEEQYRAILENMVIVTTDAMIVDFAE